LNFVEATRNATEQIQIPSKIMIINNQSKIVQFFLIRFNKIEKYFEVRMKLWFLLEKTLIHLKRKNELSRISARAQKMKELLEIKIISIVEEKRGCS
jgi:hypothetical protein